MHISKIGRRFTAFLAAGILAVSISGNIAYADAPNSSVEEAEEACEVFAGSTVEEAENACESAPESTLESGKEEAAADPADAADSGREKAATGPADAAEESTDYDPSVGLVKLYDPALETEAGDGDDLAGAASLNTDTWTKYALTSSQLLGITRLCYQEQGSLAGAAAEASLMANLLELYHTGSYGTTGTSLYNYVRNGKWFARAAHFMDAGKLPSNADDYISVIRQVLVEGKRTLPLYIDEHDCWSDIRSITGTASDGTCISGKTQITNKFSSVYTFYSYPADGSDPFGYTQGAIKRTGGATPDVYQLDTETLKMVIPTPDGQKILYRLYNPNSGEHFFTASRNERNSLKKAGWRYEGIAWYAPSENGKNVYRLYNPNSGDHHYTLSTSERDSLTRAGWKYEGVAWQSCSDKEVPLYRLYNKNAKSGAHHYTTSADERDHLIKAGWRYEGIGWYACTAA